MAARKKRSEPKAGCEFVKKFKGKIYRLNVIKSDGRTAYKVGGNIFFTPTAAAKSITKTEINGWQFWKIV